MQQMARRGKILYEKVEGAMNFAGSLTKPLEGEELWRQMRMAGMIKLEGRFPLAPASKRAGCLPRGSPEPEGHGGEK